MTDETKNEQTTVDVEAVKQFLSTDEGKKLVEDSDTVKGIIGKRNELLGEKDKWAEKWRKYEELGDYEELAKLVKQVKTEDKTKDEVDPGLLDTLRNQLQEKDTALATFKNGYVSSHLDSQIDSAISDAKGNSRLLKHVVKERVKAELTDDGKVNITVLSKDGKKMFRNDESPATLNDLLAELRTDEDLGIAFASSGATGSGTRATSSATKHGGVILDTTDPNFSHQAAMAYYAKNPDKIKRK